MYPAYNCPATSPVCPCSLFSLSRALSETGSTKLTTKLATKIGNAPSYTAASSERARDRGYPVTACRSNRPSTRNLAQQQKSNTPFTASQGQCGVLYKPIKLKYKTHTSLDRWESLAPRTRPPSLANRYSGPFTGRILVRCVYLLTILHICRTYMEHDQEMLKTTHQA